jgi:hypothetical protein
MAVVFSRAFSISWVEPAIQPVPANPGEQKMSKISRKLSLNRETLRTISGERLEQVAGGWTGATTVFVTRVGCQPATDPAIYCGPLR